MGRCRRGRGALGSAGLGCSLTSAAAARLRAGRASSPRRRGAAPRAAQRGPAARGRPRRPGSWRGAGRATAVRRGAGPRAGGAPSPAPHRPAPFAFAAGGSSPRPPAELGVRPRRAPTSLPAASCGRFPRRAGGSGAGGRGSPGAGGGAVARGEALRAECSFLRRSLNNHLEKQDHSLSSVQGAKRCPVKIKAPLSPALINCFLISGFPPASQRPAGDAHLARAALEAHGRRDGARSPTASPRTAARLGTGSAGPAAPGSPGRDCRAAGLGSAITARKETPSPGGGRGQNDLISASSLRRRNLPPPKVKKAAGWGSARRTLRRARQLPWRSGCCVPSDGGGNTRNVLLASTVRTRRARPDGAGHRREDGGAGPGTATQRAEQRGSTRR
ncbi:translation initiation factor IF-2-like [Tympanuchus pallidicinctus]|uniref:translation initiation factor IF-2-like n=1 Tax=Tympanuchus pallidicinctus TaxID=109042 RepID=UPI002286EB7C|nr:translation initiation factor IF-2-like [Tympanuchus pallidicinctus]